MDDAEFFLPSEIARLVYGHFKAMECEDLSVRFLEECPHLAECRELKKRNRTFKTEANGLPLKEILDQYLNMNKLRTVNTLVGEQRKFTDPVEAFIYLLNSTSKENQSSTNDGAANLDSPERSSSSSCEDMFSDFSLNLKTPDKSNSHEKVTKSSLDMVVQLNNTIDRTAQETTPETNKVPSISSADSFLCHNSKLQLRKTLKNDRSCNSDSIKELRLNPNDNCETPRKQGNPPYSENKLLKPKTPIALMSSDSECEPSVDSKSPIVNTLSSSNVVNGRLNGLFSPISPKLRTVKKKTIKVMRPRRPPNRVNYDKQSGDNDVIKCKRNRVSNSKLNNSNNSENKSKKSKLFDDVPQPTKDADNGEKTLRSSDEFVFTTDGSQTSEKQKVRRKSGSIVPVNKSLPVIDDVVLGEKLIKNTKLQQHIAANINEFRNSPVKKPHEADTVDMNEWIETVVNNIVGSPFYKEFENEVMETLNKQFASEGQTSNVNSVVEFPENETTTTTEINNQPLLNSQVPVEIEDSLTNDTGDIESHHEDENPPIIIQIREEPAANQESYVENSNTVSNELRNFWSTTTGLESSPDGKLNLMKSDQTSIINIVTPTGEISESCKINNDTSERIVLNSEPVLFSLNEGIPMVLGKSSEYQICGTPSSISQINRMNNHFVRIAPKPDLANQVTENTADNSERGKNPKKRRTRGGKRP